MKTISTTVILILMALSGTVQAGETSEEYFKNETPGYINGLFNYKYTMKAICSNVPYPGTEISVYEWLFQQIQAAERDNPDYPKGTVFRPEVDDFVPVPKQMESPIREASDCVERANFYAKNIRAATEENLKNAGNPDYIPYRIAEYGVGIRIREQIKVFEGITPF